MPTPMSSPSLVLESDTPKEQRPPHIVSNPVRMVRRRPDMQQGKALEKLGHAIEYLVDSRLALVNESRSAADEDAVAILASASRLLFASCVEIVPVQQRLKQWANAHIRSGRPTPLAPAQGPRG